MAGPVPIRVYGSRCLRRTARDADPGSEETRQLLDTLWSTLVDDGGVGLAAPQIGQEVRALVVRDPGKPASRQRLDLVNPVIEERFGPERPFEEGCLSFPGIYFQVMRPAGIKVSFHDREGRPGTIRDQDLVARIIQHEVDHLDGVLFIDHLSIWQRFWLLPRLALTVLAGWFRKS